MDRGFEAQAAHPAQTKSKYPLEFHQGVHFFSHDKVYFVPKGKFLNLAVDTDVSDVTFF